MEREGPVGLEVKDGEGEKRADLSTTQNIVAWKFENVHDKLRNSITANPKEYRLSILDQEKTMTFEAFRSQRERRWENDTLFTDSASL